MNSCRTILMNVRVILVSFAVAALLGADASYGQNGALGIAYPANGINIDGELGDWPKDVKKYPIERVEFGDKLGGPSDLKAQFRIAYNAGERALFVAVEVWDDSIVLDGPGVAQWNAQDSCELFIEVAHQGSGSPVVQYARYGNQDRIVSGLPVSDTSRKVAVARTDASIVYERRISVNAPLDPERVIGFDVAVADKDKDGSFSWAAWGSGTQKADSPSRCGEILIVTPETRFGEISGTVAWKAPASSALPSRVRIQAADTPQLWRHAVVDANGAYRATSLPVGSYTVRAVDSADVRVEETDSVKVDIHADQLAKAEILHISPIPWPGLIGSEGVLKRAGMLNAALLDRVIEAYLAYYKIPGISVAVIKDSKVAYSRGFGLKNTATREPVKGDTVFEAASMTKPVFAYIVMRLIDRGLLTLDTPLYTYLPYEDISYDDRYKLITARMVLTHRTGFPNWRNGKLDIKFTPGTEVSYSGEGFVYLGKVVEKLTGKKLVDLCREEVFAPMGVANASLVWNDEIASLTATGHGESSPLAKGKPSSPNVAASLHIDAGNYAKFLIAVMQGTGLSNATAAEMLRPQVKVPNERGASWGLGISINENPHGIFYGHGGRNTGFTSHSVMNKELGIGYVFLVNNDDASKIDNILNAYLIGGESSLKKPNAIAHKSAKIDPKAYDAYAGKFAIGHETVVTFTREGDRLMAQPDGDAKFEIYPETDTVFFIAPAQDATITFVKDDSGKVTEILLRREGHESKGTR